MKTNRAALIAFVMICEVMTQTANGFDCNRHYMVKLKHLQDQSWWKWVRPPQWCLPDTDLVMCSFDCSSTQGSGVQPSPRRIWSKKYPDLSREWLPPPWHHHPAHEGGWGAEECQPDRPGIQKGLALPPDQECVLHAPARWSLHLQGHTRNQSRQIYLGWVARLDNGKGKKTGWLLKNDCTYVCDKMRFYSGFI